MAEKKKPIYIFGGPDAPKGSDVKVFEDFLEDEDNPKPGTIPYLFKNIDKVMAEMREERKVREEQRRQERLRHEAEHREMQERLERQLREERK